jgi:hypothetical protein
MRRSISSWGASRIDFSTTSWDFFSERSIYSFKLLCVASWWSPRSQNRDLGHPAPSQFRPYGIQSL